MTKRKQRVFWLRDNESFEKEDGDNGDYYLRYYKEDNRSLWCEFEKGRHVSDCMAVPVRSLRFREGRVEWYPYEKPYGGMFLLKIKRSL